MDAFPQDIPHVALAGLPCLVSRRHSVPRPALLSVEFGLHADEGAANGFDAAQRGAGIG